MSKAILHIKSEENFNLEKRTQYTISIVGCGQNGLLHACLFAEAGFNVICFDDDKVIVNNLTKGKAPILKHEVEPILKKHIKKGCLKAENDFKKVITQSDVTLITTPVKVDGKGKIDYSGLEKVLRLLGPSLSRGSLIIVSSVIGLGGIENMVLRTLEDTSGYKLGVDFGLAYSPIVFFDVVTLEKLVGYKRVVASPDKKSMDVASTILKIISKSDVQKTNDVKTVEAVTLFKILQHHVNVALANEFAFFCESAGIDYIKAQKFSLTNEYGALAQSTLIHEKVSTEPYLLLEEAENLNVKLRISTLAITKNEEKIRHAVKLISEALKSCGKTLRRAKIAVLGISKTPNVIDAPKQSSKRLAKMLETKGAQIRFYDPYIAVMDLTDIEYAFEKKLFEAIEGVDCIVIFTGHNRFKRLNLKKLKVMMKMPAAIVDLEGVIIPKRAEDNGFVYRGLGRGVWTR